MVTNRFYPPKTSLPMTGGGSFRPTPVHQAGYVKNLMDRQQLPGFNPPRISPPMTGDWQDNWQRDRGFNPPRISPPMTGGGPFRPMPGGPGPGRGFLPGEPPPGTTPGRGRYPGSPPKRGRRGGPGPEWGGGQPIVIDPRTGRPTWKWSPGGSYATKVAGVYTDPEHMRRVSELARYKPIQREAPPAAAPVPGEVGGGGGTPDWYAQQKEAEASQKWWDMYGPAYMNIGNYDMRDPAAGQQAYEAYMAGGGIKGISPTEYYQKHGGWTATGGQYDPSMRGTQRIYGGQMIRPENYAYGRGFGAPDYSQYFPGYGGGQGAYGGEGYGESGTPGVGPGMEMGADEEAWGAGEGDQGDW